MSWDKINKAWVPSNHMINIAYEEPLDIPMSSGGDQTIRIDTDNVTPGPMLVRTLYAGTISMVGNLTSTFQPIKIHFDIFSSKMPPMDQYPNPYYLLHVRVYLGSITITSANYWDFTWIIITIMVC